MKKKSGSGDPQGIWETEGGGAQKKGDLQINFFVVVGAGVQEKRRALKQFSEEGFFCCSPNLHSIIHYSSVEIHPNQYRWRAFSDGGCPNARAGGENSEVKRNPQCNLEQPKILTRPHH